MKLLKTSRSFRREFRRQLRLAIAAAIGFTIAFAWRNAVYDAFQNWVARLLDVTLGHYLTEIYAALAITVIGILVIYFTSYLLKD